LEKEQRTERKQHKASRKKIVLFIVILIILVAAVVLLLVNPFHWNLGQDSGGDAASQAPVVTELPTPPPTESVPSVVSAPPTEAPSTSASGQASASPAPSPQIPEADEDVYTDPQSYIGEYVTVKGTVEKDAVHNEGMLELIVMADEGQFAYVTMLDQEGKYGLKAGDKVEIMGIITAQTEIKDANGLLHEGPMLSAQTIES